MLARCAPVLPSGEAFSRAFKARFGLSPSQWRGASAAKRQELRNLDQAAQVALRYDGSVFLTWSPICIVTLCQRPAVTVAAHSHTGPYGKPSLSFGATSLLAARPSIAALRQIRHRSRQPATNDRPGAMPLRRLRGPAAVTCHRQDMLTMTIPGGLARGV